MPHYNVTVSCPIHDSFRVQQVAGMFDVPLHAKASEQFAVHLPTDRDDWQIGLIVGPSGSGKSTIARHAFGNELYTPADWPHERAVIDAFGDLPVRKIVALFTAVGFGSPPSWIKPYHVLSGGEQFRCDLARALSIAFKDAGCREQGAGKAVEVEFLPPAPRILHPLIAFDEFTSVVDRTVAKFSSAAIAKGIRSGTLPCRFVAVTCHYDIAEWLEPDWMLDMATRKLTWRCLRRPKIELAIQRCHVAAWQLFKRHHYLSAELAPQARCYLVTWNGTPVHFAATLPMIARRNHRRFTRMVTLPDFQGLGIGMRAMAAMAALHRREGLRINVTSSHPSLICHCRRSPLWKTISVRKTGARPSTNEQFRHYHGSAGRAVVSFEFVGA